MDTFSRHGSHVRPLYPPSGIDLAHPRGPAHDVFGHAALSGYDSHHVRAVHHAAGGTGDTAEPATKPATRQRAEALVQDARAYVDRRTSQVKQFVADNASTEQQSILMAESALSASDASVERALSSRQHVLIDTLFWSLMFQRVLYFIGAVTTLWQIVYSLKGCEPEVVALCAALVSTVATHSFMHGAEDNRDRAIIRLTLDVLRMCGFIAVLIALGVTSDQTSAASCSWGYVTLSRVLRSIGGAVVVFWFVHMIYSYTRHSTSLRAERVEAYMNASAAKRSVEVVVRTAIAGTGIGLFIAMVGSGSGDDISQIWLVSSIQAYTLIDLGLSDLVRVPGGEAAGSRVCLLLDTWLFVWLTTLGVWSIVLIAGANGDPQTQIFSSGESSAVMACGATFIVYMIVWLLAAVFLAIHWHKAYQSSKGLRGVFEPTGAEIADAVRTKSNPLSLSLVNVFSGPDFHAASAGYDPLKQS